MHDLTHRLEVHSSYHMLGRPTLSTFSSPKQACSVRPSLRYLGKRATVRRRSWRSCKIWHPLCKFGKFGQTYLVTHQFGCRLAWTPAIHTLLSYTSPFHDVSSVLLGMELEVLCDGVRHISEAVRQGNLFSGFGRWMKLYLASVVSKPL
jgi:hypothetical protein